jgi:hypothetical protein
MVKAPRVAAQVKNLTDDAYAAQFSVSSLGRLSNDIFSDLAFPEAADDDQMRLQIVMFFVLLVVFFAPDITSLDLSVERLSEPVKLLPICFVSSIIMGLWGIYTKYHIYEPGYQHELLSWIFHFSTSLLVICYLKCIFIHPGSIPNKDDDPSWTHTLPATDAETGEPADRAALVALGVIHRQDIVDDVVINEIKRSGDRRSCKWCNKYKPDRCHHCRICRMCILKMDHHCPWIYNCVGYKNHKYFFLLLFYAAIDCQLIAWTMHQPLNRAIDNPSTPFFTMFILLFGETLAVFVGILVTAFFGFHIWLMLKNMTTIEFCEKSAKMRVGQSDISTYDRGTFDNIQGALGNYTIFWFLPISPPPGRGLSFLDPIKRSPVDAETGSSAAAAAPVPKDSSSPIIAVPKKQRRYSAGTGAAPDDTPGSEESDMEAGGPVFRGHAEAPSATSEAARD